MRDANHESCACAVVAANPIARAMRIDHRIGPGWERDMAISTVSFGNTPQAKDDYLLAGLTEDSTGIVCLDVMANDLGGNAKTLWSLDNGISGGVGNDLSRPVDLLTQDTVPMTVLYGMTR